MGDLIDEVMKASEEDMETFSDVILSGQKAFSPNEILRLKKTANYKTAAQKFVSITHGFHEEHYVWHIAPYNTKRTWKNLSHVLFAISQVLNTRIPNTVMVDFYLPDGEFDIDEITVKALEVANCWALGEADFEMLTGKLFEVLNTLI